MTFIPQYHYSQQSFSGDFPTPVSRLPLICTYEDETASADFFNNYGIVMPPPSEYDISMSSSSSSSMNASIYMDAFRVADMTVPPLPETSTGLTSDCSVSDAAAAIKKQLEDDYKICGTTSAPNNYYYSEIEGCKTSRVKEMEEPPAAIKIGRYSMEERKDKIMRYLKKRNLRNFHKTIKYECRKTLADKRVRVRGRFAKNNTNSDINDHHQRQLLPNPCDHQQIHTFYTNYFPMKKDYDEEEEWLQEAMASLLHSPYITISND